METNMKELQAEKEAVWEEVELFKKRAASGYYSTNEEMIAAERNGKKITRFPTSPDQVSY